MIGAIIGDIVGSKFEWDNHRSKDFDFLTHKCFFTDDSVMSLAVCDALLHAKPDYSDLNKMAVESMQRIGQPISALRVWRVLLPLDVFGIQSDALFDFAVGKSAGSLSPRVKWEHLKNFEFELPDMDKQKELAALLWAMDDTKKSYQKLIAATDELVKSQFIEMFGKPGTDPYEWGLTTLGECCELNPRRPRVMKPDIDYSFVAMPSVSEDGRIDASIERPYSEVCKGFTYFTENDVLFAKITPCMENGKDGVAKGLKNGAGFGSTEFHVLRPIKGTSDPYWLYIITMFPKFRSDAEKVMTGTGGQRRVPITYLSEYRIALPPLSFSSNSQTLLRSER